MLLIRRNETGGNTLKKTLNWTSKMPRFAGLISRPSMLDLKITPLWALEPGATARKTAVTAILNSSADIAGGEEQTWSCEVDS